MNTAPDARTLADSPMPPKALTPDEEAKGFAIMVEHVRDYAIFLTDANGVIVTWNAAAEQMKGFTAREAIGAHLGILYTDEGVRAGAPADNLRWAAEHGTFQEKAWRKRKDGSLFWAMVELIALRHDDGVLFGFCKITRDISDMLQIERRLAAERARASATLEAIHEGVISVQPDDTVDYLNLKAEELTGWCRSELDHATLHEVVREVVAEGEAAVPDSGSHTVCIEARDGLRHVVETTTSAIVDEAGHPNGAVVVLRDMSTQLQTEHALREAEVRKDEFLAMLAHELRNPLAPVSAAAALLNSGRIDARAARKASQVISRQVMHMTSLVDDLLDVSRITRGLVTLEQHAVNVKTMLAEAIEQARPLIEAKHHTLHVSLAPERIDVMGDSVRLIQVLVNLLNNAAKYTPPGGELAVELGICGEEVAISVTDNGIGIHPQMQPHVFKLFEQAQRSSDRAQGGLGIGLALVKRICELHGGTVACTSELGKGSSFTVRLPRLDSHAVLAERRATGKSRTIAVAPESLQILVVDDNVDAAEMLSAVLALQGHEVDTSHDPYEALAWTRERRFDVCILDIGLPGMDGYALCRQILAASGGDTRPMCIGLSGFGQAHDIDVAFAAGFHEYLVKPVDIGMLNRALATVPRNREPAASI